MKIAFAVVMEIITTRRKPFPRPSSNGKTNDKMPLANCSEGRAFCPFFSESSNNKQLGISLVILSAPPKWLTQLRGVETYLLPSQNGETVPFVLPWNPIVQRKLINFVTQLCLRYDGLVDYIVMGGLGINTESY